MADTLRSSEPNDIRPTLDSASVVLVSILTLAVLVLAFFYVPHWILTKPSVPERGVRVWIATAWVAFAFGASCYAAWRSSGPRAGARA